jgi:hypothetical protein
MGWELLLTAGIAYVIGGSTVYWYHKARQTLYYATLTRVKEHDQLVTVCLVGPCVLPSEEHTEEYIRVRDRFLQHYPEHFLIRWSVAMRYYEEPGNGYRVWRGE